MEAKPLVIGATTEVDHQTGNYESGDQGHCKPSRNQTWVVNMGAKRLRSRMLEYREEKLTFDEREDEF